MRYSPFVTDTLAIQVCAELTPYNRAREIEGVARACRLPGKRQALILTLNQRDRPKELDTPVEVRPVWEWLLDDASPSLLKTAKHKVPV